MEQQYDFKTFRTIPYEERNASWDNEKQAMDDLLKFQVCDFLYPYLADAIALINERRQSPGTMVAGVWRVLDRAESHLNGELAARNAHYFTHGHDRGRREQPRIWADLDAIHRAQIAMWARHKTRDHLRAIDTGLMLAFALHGDKAGYWMVSPEQAAEYRESRR